MTYVFHIPTLLCLKNCDIHLRSSHCNDRAMFITLRHLHMFITLRHLHMFVMIGLCSSHCNDRAMFVTLWHLCMFHTLWWKGYVHHIAASIYVRHIVTLLWLLSCEIYLCSSYCDERAMLIRLQHMHIFVTLRHYYVYDDRYMFITLRWEGYVCRNVMFFYVHHIARTQLCSSNFDICICLSHFDMTMFVMIGICRNVMFI